MPGQAIGTVGQTYDGVQCRLDPSNGEIQIKTPATMLGYYKEPEMTRRAFTDDGWMHTGDKGAFDAAGNLKITGRVKHAAVEACCVTGANLGQPIGLVMLNDQAVRQLQDPAGRAELEASLSDLLQATNRMLDPHEQMACLVAMTEAWTVDNELITPTLKVKRNRIEDLFAANFELWARMGQDVVCYEK